MTKKQIVSLLLLSLMSLTIFYFSMQVADVSNQQSGFIVQFVLTILVPIFGNIFSIDTFTFLVRKTAHFTEYALLGILGCNVHHSWKDSKYSYLLYIYGPINAVIDETIQYFTPGRSCQLSDMILDSMGYLFGFLLLLMLIKFTYKKKRLSQS